MSKRNVWLGTSALVAAAMVGTPVLAGQVGSKDAMSVTLGGEFRFQVGLVDQDASAGQGRGYQVHVDESEIKIGASNTADNGIKYGVSIELNAGTDAAAADEAWAFLDTDWGRIEMGDQDDATDRMYVESDDILVGRAGPDGDAGDYFSFGTGGGIAATGNAATGDNTKLIYFTPRFAGLQLGASLTPDTGVTASGGAGPLVDTDNDGDFENVFGLAANYERSFDELSIVLSLTGEFGDGESASGAATVGDVETISVGGIVTYGAFGFGAGYVDLAEQGIANAAIATGTDAGSYYTVGGSYKSGDWGVSLNWFESSKDNAAGIADTDVQIISLDAAYAVAPGWELAAALHVIEADNINATAVPVNNDGTVFLISNQFDF